MMGRQDRDAVAILEREESQQSSEGAGGTGGHEDAFELLP